MWLATSLSMDRRAKQRRDMFRPRRWIDWVEVARPMRCRCRVVRGPQAPRRCRSIRRPPIQLPGSFRAGCNAPNAHPRPVSIDPAVSSRVIADRADRLPCLRRWGLCSVTVSSQGKLRHDPELSRAALEWDSFSGKNCIVLINRMVHIVRSISLPKKKASEGPFRQY